VSEKGKEYILSTSKRFNRKSKKLSSGKQVAGDDRKRDIYPVSQQSE